MPHSEFEKGDPDTALPYFAYGSNLNLEELLRRLTAAGLERSAVKLLGPALLPDMALRFNFLSASRAGGALNVVPATGSVTSGCLLSLTPDALAFVDRKEGHPDVYERRPVTVIAPGGVLVPAMTYIVRDELTEDFVKPSEHYLHICAEGRRSVGIETRSLFTASRNAPAHHLNSLFVYGTLQRGERLFSAVSSYAVRCALLAQTRGELRSGGFFPALVPHQEHEANGELIRFRGIGPALETLDRIEGFDGFGDSGNLFDRTVLEVRVGDSRARKAWAYVARDQALEPLRARSWRTALGREDDAHARILDIHARSRPDFFERLTACLKRPAGSLDRRSVLEGLSQGGITEHSLACVSGVWAAGFGERDGW